ncbi:MAG: stalk domain-containing protein [Clostridia bacterium]
MKRALSFIILTTVLFTVFPLSIAVDANELPTLRIGMTLYYPFNFYDENATLTGFDTDLAKEVCARLGYNPEFVEISWDKKFIELSSGRIDCIWNALTFTEEVAKHAFVTEPYASMSIVIVAPGENKADFSHINSLKGEKIALEAFSQARELLENTGCEIVPMPTEADALCAVLTQQCDAAAVYNGFNGKVLKEERFKNLENMFSISKDEYVVACKYAPLADAIDKEIKALYDDGTISRLDEKYSLGLFEEIPDFNVSTPATKDDDIKIIVDNNKLSTETQSIIINNRTMVPARAIFKALGAEVLWDNDTQTVIATKDDILVEIQMGNPEMTVNHRQVELDTPACIHNFITLVPVRAISEALGYYVKWDNETKTVYIYSNKLPPLNTAY